MIFSVATTGLQDMRLPQWGRAFWQDPNDDEIFLAYASGTQEVDFITSTDGGNTWSAPELLFPVEDFHIHNNFDTVMDRDGHIHCGFRFDGSGCYQFVGKATGGGWTRASGLGPVGLVPAGDSGNLTKGFQGSLTMQETAFASEVAGVTFPAVKIVAKDDNDNIRAFVLGGLFNTGPLIDTMLFSSTNAGVDGGFPIIYVPGSTAQLVYYDEPNGALKRWQRDFGAYIQFQTETLSNVVGDVDVPFGPSMAIGSGLGLDGNTGIVLVCSSGQHGIGQGMYASNSSDVYENVFDVSNDTHLNWLAVESGAANGASSGLPFASSGIVPTGNMYGIGPNFFSRDGITIHNFPGEGTNCDFSFNDDGEFLLYFQKKNKYGKQSIGRFKADFDGTNWTFPSMRDGTKGLKHIAQVSQSTTGGWSNKLFWGGFKALKHPVEPNASGTKKELLVTQGQVATYPSGGILTAWDVADSPALGTWPESEFTFDYTLTSGTANEIFVGIASYTNVQFTSHLEQSPNIFDDDNTTFGRVRDGYTLNLELDKIRTIERIELLHRNTTTSAPGSAISGSMDGVNWTRVETIPSGRISTLTDEIHSSLFKYQVHPQTVTESANQPGDGFNSQPINFMRPFAAKFVIFQFFNSIQGNSFVYEIKLFGPATTNPETVTWSDATSDPPVYNRTLVTREPINKVESFGRQQGTLPPGWRTSGDFSWAVVGSGEFTKTSSFKPTDPLPPDFDGKVPSGIWFVTNVGNGRGVGDGFSIRSEAIGDASGLGSPLGVVPAGGIQPGMSGVLEIDINVLPGELLLNTRRAIGFNIRSDVHVDDTIEFFINNVLQETYTDIGWNTFTSYTLGVDEFVAPESFDITVSGPKTLKWVYTKGDYDPVVNTNIYPFGAAWIDSVFGLDSGPLDTGPKNHRYGFTRGANAFETSVIHGYLQGRGFTSIHGFLPSGLPQQAFIHGFLTGLGTQASGQIHGYALGHQQATSQIHGFMVGNVPIDPTGINSSIHGYATAGFGSGDSAAVSAIHGYMKGFDGFQFIHGFVAGDSGTFNNSIRKGYTLGWDGGVLGLGPNQKAIYGFLTTPLESGNSSIHSYLLGNFPVSSIHGYLGSEALVASGGGLVGNPSTSNVVPGVNFIHGYLKGELGFQSIHGYVKRPSGIFGSIHGYVLGGAIDTSIHGYLTGVELASGTIHGYASGVGFESAQIHGYAFGISGIISSNIHSYLSAVEIPASQILGTLIGTVSGVNSLGACPSHNFPLSPLLSITLPSGFIN